MKNKILFLTLLFIYAIPPDSHAQIVKKTRDLELWTGAGIEKEIINNLTLTIEKEIRLYHDISTMEKHFTQISLEYDFLNYFEAGIGVRFQESLNKRDEYEDEYRLDIDLGAKTEYGQFDLDYRLRLQNKDEDFFAFDDPYENIYKIRNRLGTEWNIPDFALDPYFQGELFYRINNIDDPFFSKIRLTIGSELKLNKHNSLKFFYRVEQELNNDLPFTIYILGLGYRYEI